MMSSFFMRTAAVAMAPLLLSSVASAALVATGSLQDEQGDPGDWDPGNSTLLLTEGSPGSGVFSYTFVNLTPGSAYEFKIIEGTPPVSFSDPQVTPQNAWLLADGSGQGTVTVDTNQLIGASPQYKVGIQGGAWTPQIVGDFMFEAGGAGDWDPQDPTFDMTDLGGGVWGYSGVISTPGPYSIKVTDGAVGWLRQFGSDGFSNNAGVFSFSTTAANQAFSVEFIPSTGDFSVSVIPEPTAIACMGLGALVVVRRRRS